MYSNRVYATNFNWTHIWRKIINESLSVTNVDLSGTVTLKMVQLTILDLPLERVHLWLSFHFRASICYCDLNLKDTMK